MAQSVDRRPIAAREHWLARRVAAWLADRHASPNGISIFGLICGLIAGAAFALTVWSPGASRALWLIGALLVQLRLAANMFDGMVALARGTTSPLGELYNEIPDRISDSAVLIGVGFAAGSWGLGCLAALAAIATAYVRAVGKAAGVPSEFSGPMAKQQRMFLVTLAALWFGLVPASWQQGLAGIDLARSVLIVIALGAVFTAGRRLLRIAAALKRLPSQKS
jgi:phosphatidylglycerophosphate synthase